MDESWSHRLCATQHAVSFVDPFTRHIGGFKSNGNYFSSSNAMEVEGLRLLIERWKKDPTANDKIDAYANDRDAKTRKLSEGVCS
jgi:hypothetical protein